MELVTAILEKFMSWVDKFINLADFYSSRYSFFIVIGALMLIAAKIFNFKIKVGK